MQILVDADTCPVKQKTRRGGGRTKGPVKRTKDDDARFESAFEQLITEAFLREG